MWEANKVTHGNHIGPTHGNHVRSPNGFLGLCVCGKWGLYFVSK